MNPRSALLAVLLTMIASAGGRVLAHHSFTMFEMDKDVTYKVEVLAVTDPTPPPLPAHLIAKEE